MKLPNATNGRVDRSKVIDYLLAFDHPEGAGKAEFFTQFGFTAAEWQIMAQALVLHAETFLNLGNEVRHQVLR